MPEFPGIVGKIVYWLAVLVISLALLVALVLFFESRDESTLQGGAAGVPVVETLGRLDVL